MAYLLTAWLLVVLTHKDIHLCDSLSLQQDTTINAQNPNQNGAIITPYPSSTIVSSIYSINPINP